MKYLILPIDDISAAIVTKAVNDADRANTIIDHRIAQEILRGRQMASSGDVEVFLKELVQGGESGFTGAFIMIVDKVERQSV